MEFLNMSKTTTDLEKKIKSLNNKQKEAVTLSYNQSAFILSGAGSGKTSVLTTRIAYLINQGLNPKRILAVTFTNKAAKEMKERIESLVSKSQTSNLMMGTFHSICSRILRENYQEAGLKKNFAIIDTSDQKTILRKLIKEKNESLLEDNKFINELINFINKRKETIAIDDYLPDLIKKSLGLPTQKLMMKFYDAYIDFCEENNCLDFADLMLKCYLMFKNNEKVLNHYQNRFQVILVDEFQDTNSFQFAWLTLLAQKHKTIFAVGDDDQSIYSFRGAEPKNISLLKETFPDLEIIKMEQNYRSTPTILNAANAVIKHNIQRQGKELWTSKKEDSKIIYSIEFDDNDEAQYVVKEIKSIIKNHPNEEFAIIYRMNYISRKFEKELFKNGLPYIIFGGLRFFDRAEIKTVMSYLKYIIDDKDNMAFDRILNIPARGIGDVSLAKIENYAKKHKVSHSEASEKIDNKTLNEKVIKFKKEIEQIRNIISTHPTIQIHQIIKLILKQFPIVQHYKNMSKNKEEADEREANINELIVAASEFEQEFINELNKVDEQNNNNDKNDVVDKDNKQKNTPTDLSNKTNDTVSIISLDEKVTEFYNQASLSSDKNDLNKDKRKVNIKLMTIHASKGLEFPIVFIVSCNDGVLPSQRSIDEGNLEEERRLMYVAITRAEKQLYITSSSESFMFGSPKINDISRFVSEIPSELIIKKQ